MTLKTKLATSITAFILTLSLLIAGVWASGSQTINLKGTVNFSVEDSTLYVKDVRVNYDSLSGQGTTIDGFMPGFVNNNFNLNIGTITSTTGSIAIYIDVVNTTATEFIATGSGNLANASYEISTLNDSISGDEAGIADLSTASISGTIKILVTTKQTQGTVSLDGISINIEEVTGFNVELTASGFTIEGENPVILGEDQYYFIINGKTRYDITDNTSFSLKNVNNITFYAELGDSGEETIDTVFIYFSPGDGTISFYPNNSSFGNTLPASRDIIVDTTITIKFLNTGNEHTGGEIG